MQDLLLEIGTEEIPAGYIEPALQALSASLLNRLDEERIVHGEATLYGSPRRLAVCVSTVAARQTPLATEVTGPPERVGFDPEGRPTVAAVKFAEKVGVPVGRLGVCRTAKGSYLCARKTEKGQPVAAVLKRLLPELIRKIPFPKTMRWADLSLAFARPIHSIVVLYGERGVALEVEGIRSSRYTRGHRFMHPQRVRLARPDEYVARLREAFVLVDRQERRRRIEAEVERIAGELGGRLLTDEALLDTVTDLVEYPAPVAGNFDAKYLELPDEVLITAMREHQKYFAVVDAGGKLLPCFIAVNNTRARDMRLVATGHERVLRARLEDARFFFGSDTRVSLPEWVEKLKGVLFQTQLGSMHAKVARIEALAAYLADATGQPPLFKQQLLRAARLCKADLVSQVVAEFPKLQGVMGRIYAARAGEPEAVARAIEEHYRPIHSGGALARTHMGALLGIADKADTICGCFSAGLTPTGASDPYALRRQGIGILQTILHYGLALSLRELIDTSLAAYRMEPDKAAGAAAAVYTFLQNRMAHLLSEEGCPKDVIAATLERGGDDVPSVWRRVQALQNLRGETEFEPLAAAFKRVANIIRKAREGEYAEAGEVDPELFEADCEAGLWEACRRMEKSVREDLQRGNYAPALRTLATLRPRVDAFFDGVMVMSEDRRLRANRIALLGRVAALFNEIADFSKLSA